MQIPSNTQGSAPSTLRIGHLLSAWHLKTPDFNGFWFPVVSSLMPCSCWDVPVQAMFVMWQVGTLRRVRPTFLLRPQLQQLLLLLILCDQRSSRADRGGLGERNHGHTVSINRPEGVPNKVRFRSQISAIPQPKSDTIPQPRKDDSATKKMTILQPKSALICNRNLNILNL